MVDTIGYTQEKMGAASLQLAMIHARSMYWVRDEILNSLRSVLRSESPSGIVMSIFFPTFVEIAVYMGQARLHAAKTTGDSRDEIS